ncbi:prenyltransferase/squalene oxidase repeat-containing protein [Compostibacter hankyongensis]|uniref:Geranylgeranyl transferase type II subunit beta n=1 Tax=Compostibacter hankyongensis TaxID=1007089 RepID=A0ABP8FJS4_9BACT
MKNTALPGMRAALSLVLVLMAATAGAQSIWKEGLLSYIHTRLEKSDGGYGWEDQPDSHLTPTYAVTGILNDIGALPENKAALAAFILTHHPQHGPNHEAGPSGAEMRNLVYQQIRAIRWLGGDVSSFREPVSQWRSQAGDIANYEKHGYPVLIQDMMTPVCRDLLGLPHPDRDSVLIYLQSRRRKNGSFNNAPAADGGDGNVLNTYWSIYVLHILGKSETQKQATITWVRNCQLADGGFTHQPHPLIGANDEVAYTWAAVKTLQLLSAAPADRDACIRYLLSLRNADGGFGNRPGLPSTPISTYYAVDALKTLNAFSALDTAKTVRQLPPDDTADLSGLKVFTVQFEAQGSGSPEEAVELADSLHIQLWGSKNGPAGWTAAAQRIADRKKVPVTFFTTDEPYGKNVTITGMGTFSHILDFIAPAGLELPDIGEDPAWAQYRKRFVQPLLDHGGALLLQISNNEPLARMLLDESVKRKGYAAISTIHFIQNFLFWNPYLYQYRYQYPFVALQDAHGTEAWWWSDELTAYRTLFLGNAPTYAEMMKALKANRVVAVRHDSLTGYKTRMLGGAPGVQAYIKARQDKWKWWSGKDPAVPERPWAIITMVTPADSFEAARPDTGMAIRIRCWWQATRPVLRRPLVTLQELRIDGTPVKPLYVEKKDRRGRLTDSYYLYTVPAPREKKYEISAILMRKEDGAQRVIKRTLYYSW